MTPERNDSERATIVDALRAESRYRGWFATIFVTTIAIVYLGSSFPFSLDQFPALRPIGHFVVAFILFAFSLTMVGGMLCVARYVRRRSSGITSLRTISARRMLRDLNRTFGARVVAVALGGMGDSRILAMRIGTRDVVGVGRGALPFVKREPEGFRYRLAHEYAHLAVGDPLRENWLSVVYTTATLFLSIAYGSALFNMLVVLADIGNVGGWPEVRKALFGWMEFGMVANLVLFGSIFLVLMLERRSAARLREFYADAAATIAVGPIANVFSAATRDTTALRRFSSRFLGLHPAPATRAIALTDHSAVYRADMMLFVLLGFFSAFVLEFVLQLLFTSASATLATFDDRRASLWRFLTINSTITSGTIVFGALLLMAVHFLVLTRLAATVRLATKRQQRLGLLAAAPPFTAAGALALLMTSQGVLWDLQQTGWNSSRYIIVGWDRLTLHGVALLALCAVIMALFVLQRQSRGSILVLGAIPVLTTLLVGYLLYR